MPVRGRAVSWTLLVTILVLVVAAAASSVVTSPTPNKVATNKAFALLPRWLPPGFSATGGGGVYPPGGLHIGGVAETVLEAASGSGRPPPLPKPNRDLFTLAYFGYHDPVKMIWAYTAQYSFGTGPGPFVHLGGRKVSIDSTIDTSGFVPIRQVYASWIEHGVEIDLSAQAVSETQIERFIANLKEEPYPTRRSPSDAARSICTAVGRQFGAPPSERGTYWLTAPVVARGEHSGDSGLDAAVVQLSQGLAGHKTTAISQAEFEIQAACVRLGIWHTYH